MARPVSVARVARGSIDRGIAALVAGIAVVALAGAAVGIVRLAASDAGLGSPSLQRSEPSAGGPFGIGDAAPTSFGILAVTHVERISGLTAKQVSGVTHVPGFVPANQMKVDVAFTVTSSRTRETAAFDPTGISLRVVGGREITPTRSSSLGPLELQPDASVTGRVSFVAPRTTKPLEVVYHDAAAPVVIGLGAGSVTREKGAPARPETGAGHGSHGK